MFAHGSTDEFLPVSSKDPFFEWLYELSAFLNDLCRSKSAVKVTQGLAQML